MKLDKKENEFLEFLKNYKVIELSIGFVVGNAVKELVTSIANNLIMPVVGLLTPTGSWREWEWVLLGAHLKIGNLIAAGLDFLIVALVVFLVIKKILKIENVKG